MIKTTLVAMTVIGCDCDARLCEYISESPPQWASVEACEAAVKSKVVQSPGIDYPLVTGICRVVAEPREAVPATTIVERTEPYQKHDRSLYETVRDSGGVMLRKTAYGYSAVKTGLSWTAERLTPTALTAWLPSAGD
jgi:hypothetical protein